MLACAHGVLCSKTRASYMPKMGSVIDVTFVDVSFTGSPLPKRPHPKSLRRKR